MAIVAHDILGSDQVGVHLAVIGSVVFHPPDLPMSSLEVIETTLECEPAPMSIGGSNLLGALLSGNRHGLAVADIASESDLDRLTSFGDVVVMEGGMNTAGNLLLCNDQGAIASPSLPEDGLEILADVLQVDVIATTIAGHDVVGSVAVCNDAVCSCTQMSTPMRSNRFNPCSVSHPWWVLSRSDLPSSVQASWQAMKEL